MPITINHVLSATTPDNTSYEIRPSHWNSVHSVSLNLSGTDISNAFANGGNVTFGTNAGGYITGNAPSTANIASFNRISAGAQIAGTNQTVIFQNSNGLQWGLNGSSLTGSYTVPSLNGLISGISVSAGAASNLVNQLTFSNSNNVSWGLNGSVLTASVQNGAVFTGGMAAGGNSSGTSGQVTAQLEFYAGNNITLSQSVNAGSATVTIIGGTAANAPVNMSAGTTSNNLATVVFSNSNNISFGLSGSTITGSVNAAGGAISGSNGSFTFGTLTVGSINGLTLYTSNSSLVGSYSVPSVAGLLSAINVSAGAASNNLSAVTLSNLNNVSFGLNGSVITGSVNPGAISVSNTSFAHAGNTITLVNANNISFGSSGANGISASYSQSNQTLGFYAESNTTAAASSTTFNATALSLVGAGAVSVGANNGSIVISAALGGQTNQTGGIYFTGNTTGQSSSSTYDLRTLNVSGAGLITAGWSSNSLIISGPNTEQATLLSVGMSTNGNTAGNTGLASQQLVLVGGNNMTLSGSTNAGSMTISFNANAGGGGGGVYAGLSNLGNTGGSTQTISTGNLVFAGMGVISLSQSTGAVNSNATISIYGPALSSVSGTGGISVSTNGSTIFIGAPASASFGISAGTTNTVASGHSFSNGSNVTFGLNGATVTASVAAPQTSIGFYATNNTLYSSSGILSAGSLIVNALGGITAGWSNGSLVLSGNTGGGGGGATTQGIYASNNTIPGYNLSVSAPLSQWYVSAVGGLSVGMSGANTLALSAPATSSLVGVNGITISQNGSTISISGPTGLSVAPASSYAPYYGGNTTTQTLGPMGGGANSLYLYPLSIINQIAVLNVIDILVSASISTGNSNASQTVSSYYGIYSSSANQLNLISSNSNSWALSMNSSNLSVSWPNLAYTSTAGGWSYASTAVVANSTSNYVGLRHAYLGFQGPITLTNGLYWIGLLQQQSSSSNNLGFNDTLVNNAMYGNGPFALGWAGAQLSTWNGTLPAAAGVYSSSTNALPSSFSNQSVIWTIGNIPLITLRST